MKSIDKIPVSKIKRASKILKTGAKVGANYLKYYGEKITKGEEIAKENLDDSNAKEIYNSLKELKGSALKVAQMISMEKGLLPQAYVDQFSLSQFSVPPLSPPLVIKTFRKYFGKNPNEIFDEFNPQSVFAASIGQVHEAEAEGKKLAVKIQYPGVADSISSDLNMVKPIALRMFNIKANDFEKYFKEVESKLIEETQYLKELEQAQEFANACNSLDNVIFPQYYQKWSSDRILTMDWMEGIHLSEFAQKNRDTNKANKIGQTLWDFYMFQIHHLHKMHADPHPGNFLVNEKDELVVLDFGCTKEIPNSFYEPYISLTDRNTIDNEALFDEALLKLSIIKTTDSDKDKQFFKSILKEALDLAIRPFDNEVFDFSDNNFYQKMLEMGEKHAKNRDLLRADANRGSKHFIYMNRTFFGLYHLMNDIGANHIIINNYKKYL